MMTGDRAEGWPRTLRCHHSLHVAQWISPWLSLVNAGLRHYLRQVMPKPRPDITDEQWATAQKDLQAQAYEALGMSASLRKKYDDSIAAYKQANAVAATPDPATWVRLGQVYLDAGKLDEAGDAFDKALSAPNAVPQVKTIAQAKKDEVAKKKAAGKPSEPKPNQE